MSWPSSILVGVLTAIAGALAAGVVANLAVGWYRISSFEAGAAAFIVSLALLGLVGGLIIGIATSRLGSDLGFPRALATSQAILIGLVTVVGGIARLMADVPPTIDGEELMLAVELRWPEGQDVSPAADSADALLTLGSVTRGSRTLRASEEGQLWTADARRIDGRWVVPGAVPLFTTRGRLALDVTLGDGTRHGFLLPLSGRPKKSDLHWTDWYPRARPGAPPLPDGFTYRYRVQLRSQPVRAETFGPFEVLTSIAYFFREQPDPGAKPTVAARATFTIRHGGQPVHIHESAAAGDTARVQFDRFDAVSTVRGPHPALLLSVGPPASAGACFLLHADAESLRTEAIPDCGGTGVIAASPITSDNAVFAAARRIRTIRGRVDRATFDRDGLFLLGHTVVDTRRLLVRQPGNPTDVSEVAGLGPLALSPDERSFVRFGYTDGSATVPVLIVTDVAADSTYTVPIDRARMRYARPERLDPTWVTHHFTWKRDAAGVDRLVARKDFVPLADHGEPSLDDHGIPR